MILEFTIFVAAILLGIVLYWRESKGNKAYRFLNKIMNSKELQMKPDDQTGFVFQQKFRDLHENLKKIIGFSKEYQRFE